MQAASLFIVSLALVQNEPTTKPTSNRVPEVLVKAFRHRESFNTAAFNCRIEATHPRYAPRVRNFQMRWANSVLFLRDHGDDDGFLRPLNAVTGELPIGIRAGCTPEESVFDRSKNEWWARNVSSPMFGKTRTDDWLDYVDVRTYGLRSIEVQRQSPGEMADHFLRRESKMGFSIEKTGAPLVRVTATGEKHGDGSYYDYLWEIDTEKGPEVVLAREYYVHPNGQREFASESKCALAQTDGVWWPNEVEIRSSGGRHIRVRFDAIEFNRPEHPKKIDADTLGIPIGADVSIRGVNGRNHYMGGGLTVDQDTWESIESQQDLGPLNALRVKARSYGTGEFPDWWQSSDDELGIKGLNDQPDLWEAYVRRWIIKHTSHLRWRVDEPLTDEQRTAAKGILDDCRKKAIPIKAKLDKERAGVLFELGKLEKTPASAETVAPVAQSSASPIKVGSSPAKPVADRAVLDQKVAELKKRAAELERSPDIERLFDELKRRLNSLLTSKQADPNSRRMDRTRGPLPPKRPRPAPSRPARPTPASRPAAVVP